MTYELPDRSDSLDSPLAERALPSLQAGRSLASAYRFCTRCWMPLAPIRRCRCAPEPYREDATAARVVGEYPRLRELAAAVAAGRYADDMATREDRWLKWLALLADRGQLDEWAVREPDAEEDAR